MDALVSKFGEGCCDCGAKLPVEEPGNCAFRWCPIDVFTGMPRREWLPLPVGVSMDGVWLMVNGEVNVDDLVCGKPGRIIRMEHADSLRYIPPAMVHYEHVAGMVSDEA